MSSRKKKKQIISACNFLLTPEKCVADTSTPLFKIFTPLFCCSLSFKEYRNPLVRINKMVKNIVYKYSLSYLFTPFSALSLANIFVEFLCQTCISHHGLESFSNQWCSDCWKMYLWVKKKTEGRHFYSSTLHLQAKLSRRFLSFSPHSGKLIIPSRQPFFWKYIFFHRRKWGTMKPP